MQTTEALISLLVNIKMPTLFLEFKKIVRRTIKQLFTYLFKCGHQPAHKY